MVGSWWRPHKKGIIDPFYRSQPWSTYAVLQTTVTAWALPYDAFIFFSCYQASVAWDYDSRRALFIFLAFWTFGFSKTVKLWGHFIRYPVDIIYIPLYVAFGYYHGVIKLQGLFTLNAVSRSPFCASLARVSS